MECYAQRLRARLAAAEAQELHKSDMWGLAALGCVVFIRHPVNIRHVSAFLGFTPPKQLVNQKWDTALRICTTQYRAPEAGKHLVSPLQARLERILEAFVRTEHL